MNVPQSNRLTTLAAGMQHAFEDVRALILHEYCEWGRVWLKACPSGRTECSKCGAWVEVDLEGKGSFIWNTEDAELCESPPPERCRHMRRDIDRVFPGILPPTPPEDRPTADEFAADRGGADALHLKKVRLRLYPSSTVA